jgi:hypothetical protein
LSVSIVRIEVRLDKVPEQDEQQKALKQLKASPTLELRSD